MFYDYYAYLSSDDKRKRYLGPKSTLDMNLWPKVLNRDLPHVVQIPASKCQDEIWIWISENLTNLWATAWANSSMTIANVYFYDPQDAMRFKLFV